MVGLLIPKLWAFKKKRVNFVLVPYLTFQLFAVFADEDSDSSAAWKRQKSSSSSVRLLSLCTWCWFYISHEHWLMMKLVMCNICRTRRMAKSKRFRGVTMRKKIGWLLHSSWTPQLLGHSLRKIPLSRNWGIMESSWNTVFRFFVCFSGLDVQSLTRNEKNLYLLVS